MGSMQNPLERPYVVRTDLFALPRPDEAHSPLAVVELAEPWAQIALDAAVFEPVPVSRGG